MMSFTECKYGATCYLQKCWFKHSEGRVLKTPAHPKPCKFGVKCHRADCVFSHPTEREQNMLVDPVPPRYAAPQSYARSPIMQQNYVLPTSQSPFFTAGMITILPT